MILLRGRVEVKIILCLFIGFYWVNSSWKGFIFYGFEGLFYLPNRHF